MKVSNLVEEINNSGYVVIPNLISEQDCEFYKDLLEDDCAKYSEFYKGDAVQEGELANKSGEKVVFNLHNKNAAWFKLFEHPQILSILDIILKMGSFNNKEPYYLNNISARCPLKGHPGQQLHIDSRLAGVNYCITANVIWLLDDFTLENGATRIVPGSHKWKQYAEEGVAHKDEVRITGKKGSALIFNANLWHGGAANHIDELCWAVALGYSRWFIKPSFDFMQNTPKHIFESLTDKQKELLGFNMVPPKDEFTRLRRRSSFFEQPTEYSLPKGKSQDDQI
jgi:ectoine hydroxylase-related dioxygenase (phytanoyl-CoA dioxygenase family)